MPTEIAGHDKTRQLPETRKTGRSRIAAKISKTNFDQIFMGMCINGI